jgi:hypothetical protein
MAQGFIVENMGGDAALLVINGNFTELYNNLPQVYKLPGISVNTQQAIAANTMVKNISISGTAGAPVLRIGITPNGEQILPDTPIGNSLPDTVMQYYQDAGFVYFTISGPAGSTVSIRIEYQENYY